jgi:hypothetical protein
VYKDGIRRKREIGRVYKDEINREREIEEEGRNRERES